ncbi:[Protein-PII] uridylyltransferase [Morus notabilis]|uniref:ACT domain-containing protein ACR n=1 Tax=Morus notabilis TaxID=981085 RepID=W9RB77_9ROSA|nr:ACT domain-containing protein ACR2 [Morus notabilis]EXB80723.1 [Protein-PII] uridylyltransferase [Morus notabilis]
MKKVSWPYFDPEFDKLSERIYGPPCRVCIDNESLEDCTVVKVDSVNKQGLLLEVLQILTDMNLTICKSYISSDVRWFMDVFHVKDEHGNKITDDNVINYIQQAIGTTRLNSPKNSLRSANAYTGKPSSEPENPGEHTAIEMTGTDRPGLFSEISAALADLGCNIVEAHAWSHNARLACVAYISDQSAETPIAADSHRIASIEDRLTTVLRASTSTAETSRASNQLWNEAKSSAAATSTNVERRLHQLMLSVRDFDAAARTLPFGLDGGGEGLGKRRQPHDEGINMKKRRCRVRIESCEEKGYWIVSVECKDRSRLMFDTVCTLTDMHYLIFHASLSSTDGFAFQEYFIRHVDGKALTTEREKERIVKCLEAAIERRVCEGIRLELWAENRVGLLSDITRVLRENGLAVVRADVATQGEKAVNAFYVRDISGNEVDMETVESMKKQISPIVLQVITTSTTDDKSKSRTYVSLGDKLKSQFERFSHNFVTIK